MIGCFLVAAPGATKSSANGSSRYPAWTALRRIMAASASVACTSSSGHRGWFDLKPRPVPEGPRRPIPVRLASRFGMEAMLRERWTMTDTQ